jgi:mannosyltransferase OCH1-like enzyme
MNKKRSIVIPNTIHQIWDDTKNSIPLFLTNLAETWKRKHPMWKYEFWDKKRIEQFVSCYYPTLLDKYYGLKYDIQRWDIIRYMILYKVGGLYVDFDYECLESVDKYLFGKSCCLGLEPKEHTGLLSKVRISNAFIATIPLHPFIGLLLENAIKAESLSDGKFMYVMETTGPCMVSRVYEKYINKDELYLFPSEMISPLSKGDVVKFVHKKIDADVLNEKLQKAIAIHYFFGTWIKS